MPPVHQPGCVGEQMMHRDRVPARRATVEPAVNGIIDREDTTIHEAVAGPPQ